MLGKKDQALTFPLNPPLKNGDLVAKTSFAPSGLNEAI